MMKVIIKRLETIAKQKEENHLLSWYIFQTLYIWTETGHLHPHPLSSLSCQTALKILISFFLKDYQSRVVRIKEDGKIHMVKPICHNLSDAHYLSVGLFQQYSDESPWLWSIFSHYYRNKLPRAMNISYITLPSEIFTSSLLL